MTAHIQKLKMKCQVARDSQLCAIQVHIIARIILTVDKLRFSHLKEASQGLISRKTDAILWYHFQSICRPASIESLEAFLQRQHYQISSFAWADQIWS